MSHWEHHRSRIFNPGQHPLKHSLSDFGYTNPALPGLSTLDDALNYIVAVLYPNYIGTYANQAALPVSASANDYAIVSDDGDGKAAGYVWGSVDGAARWNKRYDVDWSMDNILSETVAKTQALYVFKYGSTDKDYAGVALTGAQAGQHLFGGDTANQHLTLHANSGDTGGARTGYIQLDDSLRPTVTATMDLGTSALRFGTLYVGDIQVATISSTGNIAAGGNVAATGTVTGSNLSGTNTGNVTLAAVGSTANANGASLSGQVLNLQPASASFPGVVTTGTQTLAGAKTFSGAMALTLASGTGLAVTANATVGGTLVVTGTIAGSNLSGTNTGDLTVGAVGASPNANGMTLTAQALVLQPASASFPGVVTTGAQTLAGAKTFPDAMVISASGTALSVTNNATISGNLTLTGNLVQGATTFVGTELQKLRNVMFRDSGRTLAVQAGDSLFYDSTSGTWLASHPDTEITHSELTGLTTGDAGHTQFVMLAGRAGGQTIQGGSSASDSLVLESTSNVSKGSIRVKDNLTPNTDASFSVTWSGTDLGDSTHYFRDLYTQGVHKGLRLENYTTALLPTAGASKAGRLVWNTDEKQIYADSGGSWIKVGVRRFMSDTTWDGVITTLTVTVSSTITDARMGIWQLLDNANNYATILCAISRISSTQVKIDVELPLPAGSYRLLGLE